MMTYVRERSKVLHTLVYFPRHDERVSIKILLILYIFIMFIKDSLTKSIKFVKHEPQAMNVKQKQKSGVEGWQRCLGRSPMMVTAACRAEKLSIGNRVPLCH